ncbi:MAG: hypothetical protein DRI69_01260 [Bacteroidetes bacterium]|nr:MAG: hypothetical protein DRI69_01260 [Bacteroidota bacterium]
MAHVNPEAANAIIKDKNIGYRNNCAQATGQIDMSINNVRARLLNGGDVWWDLDQGKYIVPNVTPGSGIPEVSSIFAGAVWIGGFDDVGNLKMAAQTYRGATATDFWPGPLTSIGTTDADTCKQWDKFFTVLGADIRAHIKNYKASLESGLPLDCDAIPRGLRGWPSRGNPYFFEINGWSLPSDLQGLAGFHDEDKDGLYDPCFGDYPVIEVRGCDAPNFPDEMIFWIYNDNGNIHTNSQGDPIRMEIQVQAFAYATNDEINNMTFQRYKLINRAVSTIDSTFFAMWIDPDLGCHTDDYIGCDTSRSLMYVYNEDELDGTTGCDCPTTSGPVNTYCREVPMLGVDYFRGPRKPRTFADTFPRDWEFNPAFNNTAFNHFRDIIHIFDDSTFLIGDTAKHVVGEERAELGMSSFTYYMNGGVGTWPNAMTDPQAGAPLEFYRYISGSWKDGTPFSQGGSGYNVPPNELIDYAFPDPPAEQGWSMCTSSLDFGDRRTLQATGPLRLDPGEVNELIIGAVWVPDVDHPCPDVSRLFFADGLAQALFDNCFIVPRGPDAPDVDFIELDRELIMILTNDSLNSNNAFELYSEKGLEIPAGVEDSNYVFEGYKVYQLAGPDIGPSEVNDIDKARLVVQVDVKNGVNTLYNWASIPDPNPLNNEPIWVPVEVVKGADDGIRHTFQLLEDQFGSEDRRLVNHRKYYFTALAYGYNNYQEFDSKEIIGQRQPYLEGRLNIKTYSPIPRPITYAHLNSFYGEGPIVTRLSGVGAGNNFLNISDQVRDSIASLGSIDEIEYLSGEAPLEIKVFDPLRVQDGDYILEFTDNNGPGEDLAPDARWILYPEDEPLEITDSERDIAVLNEQIISGQGFTVRIGQTSDVGDQADESNGVIGISFEYDDPSGPQWFTAVPDGANFLNYLKTACPDEPDCSLDPTQAFSRQVFTPFHLGDYRYPSTDPAAPFLVTPTWVDNFEATVRGTSGAALQNLNNVDIVFTSDKSKWSRCIVVETTNRHLDGTLTPEGKSKNMEPRDSPSVGKQDDDGDGKADPDGAVDEDGNPLKGFGWFPGYAVDLESGKRLNIFFGEASIYTPEIKESIPAYPDNGNDMIWNPNTEVFTSSGGGGLPPATDLSVGGMHHIYVTHEDYDGCKKLGELLRIAGSQFDKLKALPVVTWTAIPILGQDTELLTYNDGLIPNGLTIKIRVDNPYQNTENLTGGYDYPKYRITFKNTEAEEVSSNEEINEALAAINVVPNPYFAYSTYEVSQFSKVIKITNLPAKCDVTIYSIDGRFIRQYRRNEAGTTLSPPRTNPPFESTQIVPDVEWDLNNHAGIPVASGVYIIHINAPGLGERTIKWFGVNRQFDPAGL